MAATSHRLCAGRQEAAQRSLGITHYSAQELPSKRLGAVWAIAEPTEYRDLPEDRVVHRFDLPDARQVANPPDELLSSTERANYAGIDLNDAAVSLRAFVLDKIYLALLKLCIGHVDDGKLTGLQVRRRAVVFNAERCVMGRERVEAG